MVRDTSLDDVARPEERDREPLGVAIGEVSAEERQRRHGHKPGIFLLGNRLSLARSLERALFDDGFQAVVFDAFGVGSSALPKVLTSLYSAGLIVLCANAALEPQDLPELPAAAIFHPEEVVDVSATNHETGDAQTAQSALSFAEKLRLSPDSKPARREP
jgi:hypothetical protein